MKSENVSRRQFIGSAALAAGALVVASSGASAQQAPAVAPAAAAAAATGGMGKRLATDLVALGNTGLKLTRLGVGLGSSNGAAQAAGGQERFTTFIKHAFDQGITFFDTARNYRTFAMLGPAIKGLPREKIFIQSKIEQPNNILDMIDSQRKSFNSDYVDSMLVHIQIRENWTETWKRAMDDYNTALDKKWIKSKGVSCHSLPALRASIATDWTQVHLVRVNPQGYRIDTEQQVQEARGAQDIKPVLAEIKKIKEKNRGIIGMKVFGGGQLATDSEREKSMKYVMAMPEIDAVTIGFTTTEQLDQCVKMMNKVLAELA